MAPSSPASARTPPPVSGALAGRNGPSERRGSDRIDCADLLIGLARVGRGVTAAGLVPATPDPVPAGT
ncbi:hypothetical protein ACH4ZX_24240 [Streptomyces sp. NPDC020490]|uniref:hypothetical protein n=1 Tax=Streptomyces sp. NPDC020490 TaxID=3365078 RepID=UPI0037A3C7D0